MNLRRVSRCEQRLDSSGIRATSTNDQIVDMKGRFTYSCPPFGKRKKSAYSLTGSFKALDNPGLSVVILSGSLTQFGSILRRDSGALLTPFPGASVAISNVSDRNLTDSPGTSPGHMNQLLSIGIKVRTREARWLVLATPRWKCPFRRKQLW